MGPSRIVRLANYAERAIVLLLNEECRFLSIKQTMNTVNNDTVPTSSRPDLLSVSAPSLLALLRLPL
jgi:hypothetical protein